MSDARVAGNVSWLEVERGFWVGSTEGTFVGTIERQGQTFVGSDRFAGRVGAFATRELAKRRLELGLQFTASAEPLEHAA